MKSFGKCLVEHYPCDLTAVVRVHTELAYPHPQLQRSQWTSLNGTWKFTYDNAGQYTRPSDISMWDQHIEVPFAPEFIRSGIHDTGFHPDC